MANALTRGSSRLQGSVTHSLRRRGRYADSDQSPINPFLKYAMCLVNLLFMLGGGAVGGMCLYILIENDKKVSSAVQFFFDPACFWALVSIPAFFVALLGLYGYFRENITVLKIHYYILYFCIILELLFLIGVILFLYKPEYLANINFYPEDYLLEAVEKYREDSDQQDFIDDVQDLMSCCGVRNSDTGYLDWNGNIYFNCTNDNPSSERCSVPFSCCRGDLINYQCGANMMSPDTINPGDTIYTRGCLKAMQDILESEIVIFAIAVPLFFILQIIVVCIAKAFKFQVEEQMDKWHH